MGGKLIVPNKPKVLIGGEMERPSLSLNVGGGMRTIERRKTYKESASSEKMAISQPVTLNMQQA